MFILRFFGGPIVFLSILGVICGTAYGGYMLYDYSQIIPETDKYQKYYLYGSYGVGGLAAALLLCVLCNCKNIKIGVAVMKCTALFIAQTPQVFLVPPLAIAFICSWLVTWLIFAAYLASVGQITQDPDRPFMTKVIWSDETRYALLYSLFGYLWMNAFIISLAMFIISAAAALWYFTSTSDTNGQGSIVKGIYWGFRYHLGSLAFGSFLIALVQFIRIIFEFYRKQIEKANKENPLIKVLLCLTSYLLDCLERFIKFISKNAYIQIAITGKNFCAAAWNAFTLILRNALRFGTASGIGFIFNVLGVLFIATANALAVYVILHYVPQYQGLTQNWIAPVAVAGLEGFVIGVMFMSVFSFASDTILQSFMVDEELNRPDGNRPKIMDALIEGASSAKADD